MAEVISANKRLTILGVPVKIEGNVVCGSKEDWETGTTEKVSMIADRQLVLRKGVFPFKWFEGADNRTKLLLVTWRQERGEDTLVNLEIVCGFKQTLSRFDWTGEFEVLSASYGKGVKAEIDDSWKKIINEIFAEKEMREWFERVTGAKFSVLKHD